MILFWLAGIFGGIGLGVGAGFLVGAWAQRKLKAEEARTEAVATALAKATSSERYEELDTPIGLGHPGGAAPPTFDQARSAKKSRVSDILKAFSGRKR